MRVLITGGGGFIGSHLAESHLKRGDEVWSVDTGMNLKVRHLLGHRKFHYVKASVLDEGAMEAFVIRADLVYHLAAVVGVEHYVDDPFNVLNVNILGTLNLLRLAHRHGKRLVFSSTSEVYGRNPKVPWKEEDDRVLGATTMDRWCYSTSKAAGEHYAWAFLRMGLDVSVVRYFNVFGPRLDKIDVGRVITIFMGQILRNEPLTIIGDGKQTRCFTFIDDAVRGTMAAGLRKQAIGGVFNIGDDRETTILELAETMNRICGRDPKKNLKFVKQEQIYGSRYEDIPRRVPDVTRMRKVLGVKAAMSLEKGLKATVEWFRKESESKPSLTSAALEKKKR
ncbi:MAG TPA: NAD-dependent epimerase/dehydratase family protein [Planctomycetota bacterium]|nr:NAD-dependent epimerase/dehydratase family protein [Planctomycetota bacterium]